MFSLSFRFIYNLKHVTLKAKNLSKQMIKLLIRLIIVQASLQGETRVGTHEGLTTDIHSSNTPKTEIKTIPIKKEEIVSNKEHKEIKTNRKHTTSSEKLERHHSQTKETSRVDSKKSHRKAHHSRHHKKSRNHHSNRSLAFEDDSFLHDYNLLTKPTFETASTQQKIPKRSRLYNNNIRSEEEIRNYAIRRLLQNELFEVPYNIVDIIGKRIIEKQIENDRFKNIFTITKHVYPVNNKKVTEYLINEKTVPKKETSLSIFNAILIVSSCLILFVVYTLIAKRVLSKRLKHSYVVIKAKN